MVNGPPPYRSPRSAVFLGTPEFAVPSLRALLYAGYEVRAVFTQPDRPAGRGHRLHVPPVKDVSERAGIPVYQPEKIRDEANRPLLESLAPDFLVVVAFGQILPGWLLRIPKLGPVNVHGSLLPRYRGAAPVIWAVLNGDRATGVTTMLMDEHLDTGPILLQREIPIGETATGGEVTEAVALAGAELLVPTLEGLAAGTVSPTAQDDSKATLAPRIRKEMGEISWSADATAIHNRIRALNPWPLAYTLFGGQKLQLLRSVPPQRAAPAVQADPGRFLGMTPRGMLVSCGTGTVLEVTEVRLESRGAVSGRDFAVGARMQPHAHVFPGTTSEASP